MNAPPASVADFERSREREIQRRQRIARFNFDRRTADADLQRLLAQQIESLEASHGDEFREQVRSVLRSGLLTGHSSADQVAALFSMHRRTLTRRLAAHGTSFTDLAEEGRFEFAQRMLGSTDLDIAGIAAALDYADASAFTRPSGAVAVRRRPRGGRSNDRLERSPLAACRRRPPVDDRRA